MVIDASVAPGAGLVPMFPGVDVLAVVLDDDEDELAPQAARTPTRATDTAAVRRRRVMRGSFRGGCQTLAAHAVCQLRTKVVRREPRVLSPGRGRRSRDIRTRAPRLAPPRA